MGLLDRFSRTFDKHGYDLDGYDKNGYENDWNGTYKGRPLPAGAYYYILQLEPGGAPMKGFFTIVR